jgi:catechol 2,3-dioxygenase-like lactoylglutathione lyase family enzyme
MEHVGIVVEDLSAATDFFVELGLEVLGEGIIVELAEQIG